jgi:aryl-alcohol dehydrogenase-like predicted oxidoreductase
MPNETFRLGGELVVRRLGFGSMRLTGPGVWGEPPDEDRALRVLREAVSLGVNFIDTADSYGPEVSERLIAEALHPYAEGVVVASKGGYLRDGPWQWRPDGRPEHLRSACEGSLRRLRLERLDLYYLHRVDPAVPLEESLGCLAELVGEGKIRHVGLSEVGVETLDRARRVVPVAAVQNRYNVTTRDHEGVVRVCEAVGTAFVPWFPLARGQLARRRVAALKRVAARHGASPGQVALAWLLHRAPVILPIPGTSSVEHLRENVQASTIELAEADLRELESARPPREAPDFVKRAGKRVLSRMRKG